MSENELLEKYNDLHQNKPSTGSKSFVDFLYENTEVEIPDVDVDDAWNKLHQKIHIKDKKEYGWLRIAASIVILIGVSLFVWQVSTYKETLTIASSDQRMEVTFPDGSKGILNKASSVSFQEEFGKERIVTFEGEAYFDIQKSEKPFIIKVNDLEVRVLGTAFNLVSNDQEVELSLERGLVALERNGEQTEVFPGQKATFNRTNGAIKIEDTNRNNISSWIDNTLVFDDEQLSVVFADIAEHYGIEIKVTKEEINSCRLTATFSNQSLEEVLATLESSIGLKITKADKLIKVSGKGC